MADLEGRTLDRYKLQRLMGKGGMADVYLGYDTHFDREVAVKMFKREDEDLLRRFVREAHLMASLSNPHLMPVYDAGSTVLDGANVYYIVMPFMKGSTLRAHIRHTPISPAKACSYLSDIADALDYIHQQGIIHRDIKSSNVLLDADDRCYLSDFGIARTTTDETQLTSTGNVLGTVDYIAPELFESNQRADARSDLYSLGVLVFEMVTGVLPFRGENQIAVVAMHVSKQPPSPRSIMPTISPAVERVIYKALEKRPERRYSSATEIAKAFCRAVNNQLLPDEQSELSWERPTHAISGEYVQEAQHFAQVSQIYTVPPVTGSMPAARSTGVYPVGPPNYPLSTNIPLYPPYPQRQNRKRRSSTRKQATIITIMAIVALLVILIPAIYVLATGAYSQPSGGNNVPVTSQPMPNFTETALANSSATAQADSSATAQTNSSATAQADSSATAQANATATSQANATATAQANANATATAQANATATAQATATTPANAIATAIQTVMAGKPNS